MSEKKATKDKKKIKYQLSSLLLTHREAVGKRRLGPDGRGEVGAPGELRISEKCGERKKRKSERK